MFDFRKYLTQRKCTLLKTLGGKDQARIYLLQPDCGGPFVCRIYEHPVPAYGEALTVRCRQIPQVFRCEELEGGVTVVEEEYVDGISLAEMLETTRPASQQAAAIAAEVCRGLSALHEKGIIHRDVKPENVLLTSAGRVVLLDLDAASHYDPEKHRDTSLLGTVGYAAPEQFGFGRSDVRTDVFGLGVMLNIMLTGEHPSQRLAKGELRPVIERCIAVNADQRFETAELLLRELLPVAGKDSVCPECGFITPGGGCLFCGTAPQKTRTAPCAKLWPKLAIAVLCLVIGVVAGLVISGKDGTASGPESEPPVVSQSAPPEGPQPVQTEVTLYDRNYVLAPASFIYEGETYSLNAGFDFGGYLLNLSYDGFALRDSNTPEEEKPLPSQCDRIIAPVIWKQNENGEVEAAEELAHLLVNPTVTLYRLQTDGEAPEIFAIDPFQGIWHGCTYYRFHSGSTGQWLVEVKATIEGTEYSSYSIIQVSNKWIQ